MPLQALLPFISGAANAASTGFQNAANRKFSREMYDRQRQDAIYDWNMQNEYNRPDNQMARLKEAGLNPNLVYGNGGSSTPSVQMRGSDPKGAMGTPPQIDLGGALAQMVDILKGKEETSNLIAQRDLLKEQLELARKTGRRMDQDFTFKNELNPMSLDALRASTKKTMADTTYTQDANRRAENMQAYTIAEVIARTLNIRENTAKTFKEKLKIDEEIKILKNSQTLQEFDIAFRKEFNIPPGTTLPQTAIRTIIKAWDVTKKELLENKDLSKFFQALKQFFPTL